MPITIVCPLCGNAGQVPDNTAGQVVACHACSRHMQVPVAPVIVTEAVPVYLPPAYDWQAIDDVEVIDEPRERRRRRVAPPRSGFQCIHCGTTAKPRSEIVSRSARNSGLAAAVFIVTVVTCGIGLIPGIIYYRKVADRTHHCVGCGIKLGG